MAITKIDIHATADKIIAEGGNPTLAAIRKALGGGSFTTISESMKEWKVQHQAKTLAAPLREAAPASVSDRLNVFGSEIWAIALEMANARLQSEREALELVRLELEETQAEAIDLADQLTIEIEQAQATIQQQQDTLARQAETVLESNARLESEKAARQDAERKCEVIEAAMVEVRHQAAELKSDTQALRSEVADISKKLANAEINLSNTVDRLDQTKTDLEKSLGTVSEKDALIAELKIQAAKDQAEIMNTVKVISVKEFT